MPFDRHTAIPDRPFVRRFAGDSGQSNFGHYVGGRMKTFAEGIRVNISHSLIPVESPTESAHMQHVDKIINRFDNVLSQDLYTFELTFPNQPVEPVISVIEGNAEVENNSKVKYIEDGRIVVSVGIGNKTQVYDLNMSQRIATSFELSGYAAGSLGADLYAQSTPFVESELQSLPASTLIEPYLSFPSNSNYSGRNTGGVDQFTRNPNFLLTRLGVDCTPLSPAYRNNSGDVWRRAPTFTLISPNCVSTCKHYHPPIGAQVAFVGMGNELQIRTVTDIQQVGTRDTVIGILDAPVTAPISPPLICPKFELIPDYIDRYIDNELGAFIKHDHSIPYFGMNQHERLYISNTAIGFSEDIKTAFAYSVYSGDSGTPRFYIKDGKIAYYSDLYQGVNEDIDQHNAVIASLASNNGKPTDVLTTFDLSTYTTF